MRIRDVSNIVAIVIILSIGGCWGFFAWYHYRVGVVWKATIVPKGSAESIRAALATYAAEHRGGHYPSVDMLYNSMTLRAIVNANGGTLPESQRDPELTVLSYQPLDGDGGDKSYHLVLCFSFSCFLCTQEDRLVEIAPHAIRMSRGCPRMGVQ